MQVSATAPSIAGDFRHALSRIPRPDLPLCCGLTLGQGEHEVISHVAAQGRNAGDFILPAQPCRRMRYVESVAGRGYRKLAAAGTCPERTARDACMLTSASLDAQGGCYRFDRFTRRPAPRIRQAARVGTPE